MIVNTCFCSAEPNIGLKLNMDRLTLKTSEVREEIP